MLRSGPERRKSGNRKKKQTGDVGCGRVEADPGEIESNESEWPLLKQQTELAANEPGTVRNVRRSLFWMVVVALLLRLVVMSFLYPERTDPYRDHWRLGGESGRIARSIVQGEGFSNPLFGKTGPTAWLAPVFPYLLAGIFKIFGIYSNASAIVALALDCLLSALTCIPVYFIAKKHFGVPSAVWAGWAWAFFPYGIYFSADFIWATTLTTLLMTLVFLSAIYLETSIFRLALGRVRRA